MKLLENWSKCKKLTKRKRIANIAIITKIISKHENQTKEIQIYFFCIRIYRQFIKRVPR
jgi:hypothetical protein